MKTKVLFICTGNQRRSPTAERIANKEFGGYFEARSRGLAGINGGISVTQDDLDWADELVTMEPAHEGLLRALKFWISTPIFCLEIADRFQRDDKLLCKLVRESCAARASTGKWYAHGTTLRWS